MALFFTHPWWLKSRLVHYRLIHGWITHEHMDVGLPVPPFLQQRMHSSYLACLGYRTWSMFLLWHICALLCWFDGVYLSHLLVVGLRLLWDLQVVPRVTVPVLWVSHGWCRGQFLYLVWLATPMSLLLLGNHGEIIVGPIPVAINCIHIRSFDLDVSNITTFAVCEDELTWFIEG